MEALPTADDRSEQHDVAIADARGEPARDLGTRDRLDRLLTPDAVLHADLGEEQPQIVRHLGHGRDGRLPPAAAQALLDRDRRRDAGDVVDVGTRQHLHELPDVGREALEVAPLPLGEHDVEGERRLPEPESPVTTIMRSRGSSRSRLRRLCSRAPTMRIVSRSMIARAVPTAGTDQLSMSLGYERSSWIDTSARPPPAPSLVRDRAEEAPRVRRRTRRDLLGRPDRDHLAAAVAALRPEVDHVIGALDHLDVVLDDEQRVAALRELRERPEQALDVGVVQPRRRLVEDEERVRLGVAAEVGGELDALRLPAESVLSGCPSRR